MPIKNRIADLHDEVAAWRQDIHRHPELLFETHRTSALVAERLAEFGCDEVVTGIGRTGVVGVIRGRKEGEGFAVGLRADMDALPIQEATGLDYASRNDGVMHACGHDGHTAMLLGAAKYLAETRNFSGTAVVIFQPAEEGGGGGKEMVDEGLMDRFGIREVYGMHNMPGIPGGQFAIRSGAFFASADQFTIVVRGRGGHAAKPHVTVDPAVAASHVVVALQTVASRGVDPMKAVVVSVCGIRTESDTHNVIPQSVRLQGTIRALDADVRDFAERRVREIADATARAHLAEADVRQTRGYPVMVNSDAETNFARRVAESVTGRETMSVPPIMGAEDFSYMLEARPGSYILLGNGDTAPVHNAGYDFNDAVIPAGVSYWADLVETRMPAS